MHRTHALRVVVAPLFGSVFAPAALGQAALDPSIEVPVALDSGLLADPLPGLGLGQEAQLVWESEVGVPGATWVRVGFGPATQLAGRHRHQGGSFLVITSHADGARHVLDGTSLPEWSHLSAYMNGAAVTVQLFAGPGAGDNRIVVDAVTAGLYGPPESICGPTDDRVPDNDPRVGRLGTGCTGWLINENETANEFLTAGHCIGNGQGGAVMMFNVPPATAAGGNVAPPPEFQYPVQAASIQSLNNPAIGDEFARFNTNNNSNTGLPARLAQGRFAFLLARAAPAGGNAATTVRGYGIVNGQGGIPLVPDQWNRINKTHTAPYVGKVGTRINYMTDTDNVNSGSPVSQVLGPVFFIEEAIGIHTDGLCPGQFNSGTAVDHPGLQAALAAPQGTPYPYDAAIHRALTTTFNSDNGGSDGGSIFFDVRTGLRSIKVTSILLNINREGSTNNGTATEDDDFFNFEVFITPGTAQGNQTNAGAWTKVADGAGMPRAEDNITLGALKNPFTLSGSQSYGMAIVFDDGAAHAYTNATGSNETHSNADLTIIGISASNSAFGSNISGRVFNGGLGYTLNQSSGNCLETLYANNNNGFNGGMVYFDVDVGPNPITITGISTSVEGAGGLDCDVRVHRTNSTHVGKENTPAQWNLVATASGPSSPIDQPSHFALDSFVHLAANSSHGFAIELSTSGGSGVGHAYTNGNGLNQSYANADLELTLGAATNAPFSGEIFSPRVWNGALCYGIDLGTCPDPLVAQTPPDPGVTGFNSTPGAQEEADNISHGQGWTVTGGTFWAAYSNAAFPPASQAMVFRFFQDAGGLPGALIATRNVNGIEVVDTGLIMGGGIDRPIYQYNVTFAAPVVLPPGTQWVSALGNTVGHTWAWARTNTVPNAHAVRVGAGAWSASTGDFAFVLCGVENPPCYPDCNQDGALTVADFGCFQTRFVGGDPYADCNTDGLLTVADFGCFQTRFVAGCP